MNSAPIVAIRLQNGGRKSPQALFLQATAAILQRQVLQPLRELVAKPLEVALLVDGADVSLHSGSEIFGRDLPEQGLGLRCGNLGFLLLGQL